MSVIILIRTCYDVGAVLFLLDFISSKYHHFNLHSTLWMQNHPDLYAGFFGADADDISQILLLEIFYEILSMPQLCSNKFGIQNCVSL